MNYDITLGGVFLFAVLPGAPVDDPLLVRQWIYALSTMVAYLLLGIMSFGINIKSRYRPWMAWPVITDDVAFLVAGVRLALLNIGVPAGYLVAMPPVWLVPLVLAFGALRYNPLLRGYVVVLLAIGLTGAAIETGDWAIAADAPPPLLGLFFRFRQTSCA